MKSVFDTHGADSRLNHRSGETVEIVRPLTEKEADLFETGPMFRIKFDDGEETDAFLDEIPDVEKYRLGEVIFDITTCAYATLNSLADHREIDSRDLFQNIFDWAGEFEQRPEAYGEEYMTAVEEFAYAKLRQHYGLEGD